MFGTILATQIATAMLSMPCANLKTLAIPRGEILSAELVAEGMFLPPPSRFPTLSQLIPEHCRVRMVLRPSSDSNINVDLWLPVEHWNGKFLAVGNGGWAGRVQGYRDMQDGLRRGYATAGTDTGHSEADGPVGMFALGHPEKIVDFAYRAVHEMSVKSKRVIASFYERPMDYAYFKGCSTGGRQAVMSAQRYPGDFDGIIAGALANRHVHMHTSHVTRGIRLTRHPEEKIDEATAAMVNTAVMRECDTLNEGFLNNPRECAFDFSSLRCSSSDGGSCLTEGQLRTVETFYGGTRNSKGELIFSGQALGNPLPELQGTETESPFVFDSVRILGFQDADYDWREFDLDRDMPRIAEAAGFVDAVDPDLRAFEAYGGKLLLYSGWRDSSITPENTILYYERVLEEMGPEQHDWMRLFLVPGMGHCGGGDGPHTFDTIAALEQWREQDAAPQQMVGMNPRSGLSRPLCPYPQHAEYDGTGELTDAGNWSCVAP